MVALRIVLISFLFVLAGCSFDGDPTCGLIACTIGTTGFALGLMRLCSKRCRERWKENLAAVLLGLPLAVAAGVLLGQEISAQF